MLRERAWVCCNILSRHDPADRLNSFLTQTRPVKTPARSQLFTPTQAARISQRPMQDVFSPRSAVRQPLATIDAMMTNNDDDDDLDEDNIPGFSHPGLASPLSPNNKGKGRAREPEQLAQPSGQNGSVPSGLSGNIGSASGGNGPRSARQTVGGIQVETR